MSPAAIQITNELLRYAANIDVLAEQLAGDPAGDLDLVQATAILASAVKHLQAALPSS